VLLLIIGEMVKQVLRVSLVLKAQAVPLVQQVLMVQLVKQVLRVSLVLKAQAVPLVQQVLMVPMALMV
jgi:hypothetical protein